MIEKDTIKARLVEENYGKSLFKNTLKRPSKLKSIQYFKDNTLHALCEDFDKDGSVIAKS